MLLVNLPTVLLLLTLACWLQGLEDVYKGGGHEERMARSIEMALTTKDEFGHVMTPKQRFRQLCYE